MAQNAEKVRNGTTEPVFADQRKIKKKRNAIPYQGNDKSLNMTREDTIKISCDRQ